jgi:hypothetical protein
MRQAHEYEQRAHRRGNTELAEAFGTTAVQRTHSSAGWVFHPGGLPCLGPKTPPIEDVLSLILCSDGDLI